MSFNKDKKQSPSISKKDDYKNDEVEDENENVDFKLEDLNFSLEDVFVNLRLFSKIEVGDKLVYSKENKHMNIDTSYFQFITRLFRGMNRNNNVQFISLVLAKAFEYNDKLILEKTEQSCQILFRLTSDFKNALNGLNNLKLTYSYDKLIQSEIDVMIDNIRSKIDNNSKNVNFQKL